MGAKGNSLDVEDFEKAWMEKVEDNLIVKEGKTKVSYTIVRVKEVGDRVACITIKAPISCAMGEQNGY